MVRPLVLEEAVVVVEDFSTTSLGAVEDVVGEEEVDYLTLYKVEGAGDVEVVEEAEVVYWMQFKAEARNLLPPGGEEVCWTQFKPAEVVGAHLEEVAEGGEVYWLLVSSSQTFVFAVLTSTSLRSCRSWRRWLEFDKKADKSLIKGYG